MPWVRVHGAQVDGGVTDGQEVDHDDGADDDADNHADDDDDT